jgi:ribose 5-phosphate isomerase B
MQMRIAVGFDDATEVTDFVAQQLEAMGHEVMALEPESWPDVAEKVARAVASGEADQGILFCWTGTGTAMAANKVAGVRAALAWEPWVAKGARLWNDANVLVMSSKRLAPMTAGDIVEAWFSESEPDAEEADNIRRLSELDRRK